MRRFKNHRQAPARIHLLFLTVIGLLWLLVGCGGDESPVAVQPTTGSVVFNFDHEVGGAALVMENSLTNFPYTNAAGNSFNVSSLEYFVSNFRVRRTDGAFFGPRSFLFVDADDVAGERSYTLSGVPPGTYNAVVFTFGLDSIANVTGGLLDEQGLPVLRLEWPENWGGGYHYLELNGQYSIPTGAASTRTHTGRRFIEMAGDPSGEGPDSVAFHHFFELTLPVTPFQVAAGDVWDVEAIMDVAGWYENPVFDFTVFFPPGDPEIMVDLTAQQILMQNGMNNVYRVTDPVKR